MGARREAGAGFWPVSYSLGWERGAASSRRAGQVPASLPRCPAAVRAQGPGHATGYNPARPEPQEPIAANLTGPEQ